MPRSFEASSQGFLSWRAAGHQESGDLDVSRVLSFFMEVSDDMDNSTSIVPEKFVSHSDHKVAVLFRFRRS
jgi:hypothetical protein